MSVDLVGPICWVDKKTTDGRVIDHLHFRRLPVPVMAELEHVGSIRGIDYKLGKMTAHATISKKAWNLLKREDKKGEFVYCGVDLGDISCDGFDFKDYDELLIEWSAGRLTEHMTGTLMGCSLYERPGAFPKAKLRLKK